MPAESYSDDRLDATLGELKPLFNAQFNTQQQCPSEWLVFTFAPGRVNFIGEHVDYMNGFVCPAAVSEGTHILLGRVKTPKAAGLRFYATYNSQSFELSRDAKEDRGDGTKDWRSYVRGAVTLRLAEHKLDLNAPILQGLCFVLHGTLPMGAGMSASASFCVALGHVLESYIRQQEQHCAAASPPTSGRRYSIIPQLPRPFVVALAREARQVEVKFCGVNCGIMDQMASALSEDNKFMVLDCHSCEAETFSLAPLLGDSHCFVLFDSMVKHELAGGNASAYNQLSKDQEGAERNITETLFSAGPAFHFSTFARTPWAYNTAADQRTPESAHRRDIMAEARPFLSTGEYERGCYQLAEQQRTLRFRQLNDDVSEPALSQSERIRQVGELLNATHRGLRDLLRVSTEELNLIHAVLSAEADCAGSRLMGAGFGGCVISLIKKASLDRIAADVKTQFAARYDVENKVYPIDRLGSGVFSVSIVG